MPLKFSISVLQFLVHFLVCNLRLCNKFIWIVNAQGILYEKNLQKKKGSVESFSDF